MERVFIGISVLLRCYCAFVKPILEYCSPVWVSAAECHLQRLECQVFLVSWLCPDQSFLSLSHWRHVAALWMLYKVNSNSNHCLFGELPSASVRVRLRLWLIHWSLKYKGVERLNLQGVSCRPTLVCGMTFPTVFGIGMGLREQSIVGCILELCFSVFFCAGDCGVAKAIYK